MTNSGLAAALGLRLRVAVPPCAVIVRCPCRKMSRPKLDRESISMKIVEKSRSGKSLDV